MVEESLRELEHKITDLKTRGAVLQPDQISNNELMKLQVHTRSSNCMKLGNNVYFVEMSSFQSNVSCVCYIL